jgi:hypothetical protein
VALTGEAGADIVLAGESRGPTVKALKRLAIVVAVYVGIVVLFESLIGFFQPESEGTLVITTTGEDGSTSDRVVSRLESGGQLYVAANHWPRAWYESALANPKVQIALAGEKSDRLAQPVTGEEHARVDLEHSLPLVFRFLTGFPPRYFLRLDPR